jgi:hypothetical protein
MKQRIQGIIIGVLVMAVLFSGMNVFASLPALRRENIEVAYGYNVYVDGVLFEPRHRGEVLEPFGFNGWIYAPFEHIAVAMGKAAYWESETRSLYLGKRTVDAPDRFLDAMQYTDFKYTTMTTVTNEGRFHRIVGTVTDHLDTIYDNGIILRADSWTRIRDDADHAHIVIDYPLERQYRLFTGNIVLPRRINIVGLNHNNIANNHAVDVLFYGDGRLIHTAINVTNTLPFDFSINVSNISTLTIKVRNTEIYQISYVALTDLGLYLD